MTTQQGVRREYERPRRQNTMAWVVAALIVIGGIIAFLFFVIKPSHGAGSQPSQQVTTLQTQLGAAQARANLATLRANLLTNTSDQTLTQEYDTVRSQLQDAYGNASGQTAAAWKQVKPKLDNLKNQITQNRQKAAATVESILNSLPNQ